MCPEYTQTDTHKHTHDFKTIAPIADGEYKNRNKWFNNLLILQKTTVNGESGSTVSEKI